MKTTNLQKLIDSLPVVTGEALSEGAIGIDVTPMTPRGKLLTPAEEWRQGCPEDLREHFYRQPESAAAAIRRAVRKWKRENSSGKFFAQVAKPLGDKRQDLPPHSEESGLEIHVFHHKVSKAEADVVGVCRYTLHAADASFKEARFRWPKKETELPNSVANSLEADMREAFDESWMITKSGARDMVQRGFENMGGVPIGRNRFLIPAESADKALRAMVAVEKVFRNNEAGMTFHKGEIFANPHGVRAAVRGHATVVAEKLKEIRKSITQIADKGGEARDSARENRKAALVNVRTRLSEVQSFLEETMKAVHAEELAEVEELKDWFANFASDVLDESARLDRANDLNIHPDTVKLEGKTPENEPEQAEEAPVEPAPTLPNEEAVEAEEREMKAWLDEMEGVVEEAMTEPEPEASEIVNALFDW